MGLLFLAGGAGCTALAIEESTGVRQFRTGGDVTASLAAA